jgi:hypothetical protein
MLLNEPKVNNEVVFTLECRLPYWKLMVRFRSQGNRGSIGDGQISSGTGFSSSNSVYTCQSGGPRGTAVAQWLRYCATNRKVAGSIPDGVIGIFH